MNSELRLQSLASSSNIVPNQRPHPIARSYNLFGDNNVRANLSGPFPKLSQSNGVVPRSLSLPASLSRSKLPVTKLVAPPAGLNAPMPVLPVCCLSVVRFLQCHANSTSSRLPYSVGTNLPLYSIYALAHLYVSRLPLRLIRY